MKCVINERPAGGTRLAGRLLKAGFWFFLAKGLLWLIAPWFLYQAATH